MYNSVSKNVNIYVDKGIDYSFTIDFSNIDENFIINEWEYFLYFAKQYSSDYGCIHSGKFEILNDATIKIVISSDETETLDCGKYRYNLIMTNLETGEKYNILQGLLFLLDVVEE